jgi:hypothetical protein
MKCSLPPAFACKLFESVLPGPYREAMFGDLLEEYALRAESASSFRASRWFWSQLFRSLPSMIWTAFRCGNWRINLSTALGVYVLMGILKFAADWMISPFVASDKTTQVILAPIVFLAITATGGCVVARLRRSSTIFLALIVMITVAVLINLRVCEIPVPWWYQFGFLTLGPLAVLMTPALFGSLNAGTEGRAS